METFETVRSGFREHEKFWAFVVLVLAILVLALVGSQVGIRATTNDVVNQAAEAATLARLRILDGAVVGLIGIAGMAAQALFRSGSVEKTLANIADKAADKAPPQTGEAAAALALNGGAPGLAPELYAPPPAPEPIPMDAHAEDVLPDGVDMVSPSWEKDS